MLRPQHPAKPGSDPSRGDCIDAGALVHSRTAPGLREPDFQSGRAVGHLALGQEARLRARPPQQPGDRYERTRVLHTARPRGPGPWPGEQEEQPGDHRGQQRGITVVRGRAQARGARLRVK